MGELQEKASFHPFAHFRLGWEGEVGFVNNMRQLCSEKLTGIRLLTESKPDVIVAKAINNSL